MESYGVSGRILNFILLSLINQLTKLNDPVSISTPIAAVVPQDYSNLRCFLSSSMLYKSKWRCKPCGLNLDRQ